MMQLKLEGLLIKVLQQADSNVIVILKNGSFLYGRISFSDTYTISMRKDAFHGKITLSKNHIATIIPVNKRSNIKKIIEKLELHKYRDKKSQRAEEKNADK